MNRVSTLRDCSRLPLLPFVAAVLAHAGAGPPAPAQIGDVDALVTGLSDRDPLARRRAALSLALLGETAAPAIPALVEALDDTADGRSFAAPVEDVRADAVCALVRIGTRTVPDLMLALDRDDDRGRVASMGAALVLARFDSTAGAAAGRLRRRAAGVDADLAFAAQLALPAVEPPAYDALAAIVARIANAATCGALPPDDRTLDLGFDALARAGGEARTHLRLLLSHPSAWIRVGAAATLLAEIAADAAARTDGARIDDAHSLEILEAAAVDPDDALAARALLGLRSAPRELVARLVETLPPPERAAARAATAALRLARADASAGSPELDEARAALGAALAEWPAASGRAALSAIGVLPRAAALALLAPLLTSAAPEARLAAVATAVDLGADENDAALLAALRTDRFAATPRPLPPEPSDAAAVQNDVRAWLARGASRRRRGGEPEAVRIAKREQIVANLRRRPSSLLGAALVPRLEDPDAATRLDAATLWLDLAPDDPRGLETLLALLDDKDLASAAEDVIPKHGGRRMKSEVLQQVLSERPTEGHEVILTELMRLGSDSKDWIGTLAGLAESAREKSAGVAKQELLRRVANTGEPGVAAGFARWFARTDLPNDVRIDLLREWAGGPMRVRADPRFVDAAIAFLERACAAHQSDGVVDAAEILCVVDPSSPVPVRALMRVMKGEEGADRRKAAAEAFAYVGDEALPALRSMIHDNSVDPVDRQWAGYAIGGMAGPVAPIVEDFTIHAEAEVRRWIVEGLRNWNGGEKMRRMKRNALGLPPPTDAEERRDRADALAAVAPLLAWEDPSLSGAAAVAVLTLDCSATTWNGALDRLLALLDAADKDTWRACGDHLSDFARRIFSHEPGRPGEADRETCERLRERLDDELERRIRDPKRLDLQRHAATLGLTASYGNQRRISALLDSDDLETAICGAWGLQFVDDDRRAIFATLKGALSDSRPWVRANAAKSLLSWRAEGAAARATLEELAKEKDERLATWCRATLDEFIKTKEKGGGR